MYLVHYCNSLVILFLLGSGKFSGKFRKGQTGKPEDTYRSVKMTEKDYEISDVVLKIAEEVKRSPAQVVMNWTLNRPYAPVPIAGVRYVCCIRDKHQNCLST